MCADLINTRRWAACLVLAAALAVGADAQGQTATQDDLRALVFYLQQGDQPAVLAELRRLRTQFPDWRPPSDMNQLLLPPGGEGSLGAPDVAGIWQRIERGDHAGARRLIDQERRSFPDWSPDTEMLRVLDLNQAQQAFDRAVAARNAPQAISVARRTPQLMRCDRINNAWNLAEMYQVAGQTGSAVETYRSTLASCTRFSDMQPTLEKADAIASSAQMTDLFDAARAAAPASTPRLNELAARLRAGRGQSAQAPAGAPATTASSAPTRSTARAGQSVPQGQASAQTQPLPPSAQPSLSQPIGSSAPSVAIAGPVDLRRLPLRGDSRVTAARASKEAESWSRCLAQSRAPQSLELLYERSWCALAHDRPSEALAGFAAVAERANDLGGVIPRDVRYGLALAHLTLNMTEEGARIAATVNLTPEQRRELETIVLDQRGVRAFRLEDYRQAIAHLNALEQVTGTLRRDLAILRAYAYLNSGQRSVALEQFERMDAQLATAETRAGLNAARGGP